MPSCRGERGACIARASSSAPRPMVDSRRGQEMRGSSHRKIGGQRVFKTAAFVVLAIVFWNLRRLPQPQQPRVLEEPELPFEITFSLGGSDASSTWVEVVSWLPRALLLHNFLSHSDCDHIQKLSLSSLSPSKTSLGFSEQRTSSS